MIMNRFYLSNTLSDMYNIRSGRVCSANEVFTVNFYITCLHIYIPHIFLFRLNVIFVCLRGSFVLPHILYNWHWKLELANKTNGIRIFAQTNYKTTHFIWPLIGITRLRDNLLFTLKWNDTVVTWHWGLNPHRY